MLSLAHEVRVVEGVQLALDDQENRTWYVLPPPPTVVVRDGLPAVELLRYERDGALVGILSLRVHLAWPEGAVEAARLALVDELNRDDVVLLALPVVGAQAELQFAGREDRTDGEVAPFEVRNLGMGQPALDSPHELAFDVALDSTGVALVEAALRSGGAPIGVVYRLQVEALRPAQQVMAQIDWGRVYDHFSTHSRTGAFLYTEDVRRLTEELRETGVIRISAVQALPDEDGGDVGAADSLDQALSWVHRAIVERFCQPAMPLKRQPAQASLGTVGEILHVGQAYAVKKLTQVERVVATIDLTRETVVRRTLVTQAHLADLLGDADPDDHMVDALVDQPEFFDRARLDLGTARPLADMGIREISGEWLYGAEREPVVLTADAPNASLSAWADGDPTGTWALVLDAELDDSHPALPGERVTLPRIEGQTRRRTLDIERLLGLHELSLSIGTPPEGLRAVRIRVAHSRDGEPLADQELSLSAEPWSGTVTLLGHRAGDRITVSTTWFFDVHGLLDGPVLDADTRVLRLQPPPLEALQITLFGADDWTGLDRVIVHVQRTADSAGRTVVFDGPGQMFVVALPLPDPTDRSFRYRSERLFLDDSTQDDDWIDTDRPVVLIGGTAANRLVVTFEPLGPELPEAGIHHIQIELLYLDPANQVRHEGELHIRAVADRPRWDVQLTDPDLRDYEYRLITWRTSGDVDTSPWKKTRDALIVVPITP